MNFSQTPPNVEYPRTMQKSSLIIAGFFGVLNACTYTPPTATGSSGTDGTGGNAGAGAGGPSSSASGSSSSSGGVGGSGGGPPMSLVCPPLPMNATSIVDVTKGDASLLMQATKSAAPGTHIRLEPGTYEITSSLIFAADNVVLTSTTENAGDVIIDGKYNVDELVVINASNVTLAHVTLKQANHHLVHIYPDATNGDVLNTHLIGLSLVDAGQQFVKINSTAGAAGYVDNGLVACSAFDLTAAGRSMVMNCGTGGITASEAQGWQIRNNLFRGIYCDSAVAAHAVHFSQGSRDTLVENNRIIDCARGIGFGLQGGAGTRLYADNPHMDPTLAHFDGIIRNNVIYGDNARFDTGIEIAEARVPKVYHNTVVKGGNATGFYSSIDYRFLSTFADISNNLVSLKITVRDNAMGLLGGNFEDVPLTYFLNPSAHDFHLLPSAESAIDKGVTLQVPSEAGVDIDGQPHNLGIAPDIGADEIMP